MVVDSKMVLRNAKSRSGGQNVVKLLWAFSAAQGSDVAALDYCLLGLSREYMI